MLAALGLWMAQPAWAPGAGAQGLSFSDMLIPVAGVRVVQRDRGGYVGARGREIERMRREGERVEIRGICLSACTMYLDLPNVCVAPDAVLGFHGPSDHGRPLSPERFERWSREMARHYREPLYSWYMKKARYETQGYFSLRGAQLIAMGYPRC